MRIVCVMGVAGCGKSTVGAALAEARRAVFMEADAHHPQANIEKMTAGVPLTDEDRWPWLEALGAAAHLEGGGVRPVVMTCSALKRVYRERLSQAAHEPIFFVHLAGDKRLVADRMSGRSGHFMPPSLIDSQFAALEPLAPDEPGLTLDIADPPETLIAAALKELT